MPISASSGLMESLKPAAHNLKAHYVIMAALSSSIHSVSRVRCLSSQSVSTNLSVEHVRRSFG